jgi:hypothetical protein
MVAMSAVLCVAAVGMASVSGSTALMEVRRIGIHGLHSLWQRTTPEAIKGMRLP